MGWIQEYGRRRLDVLHTREFYIRIGCTLAAQLPDYYDEGDDKLIYLKRIR